jgi:hypothetical protein
MTDREKQIARIITEELTMCAKQQGVLQWMGCGEVTKIALATIYAAARRIADTEMAGR